MYLFIYSFFYLFVYLFIYYYLLNEIELDLDLHNFGSIQHILSDLGLGCSTNFLTDNSRKSSYFSSGISVWLIHLTNPSPMYNKIKLSPAR